MNDVLYTLCRHSCDMMEGWHPFPARLIAQQCGISIYKARKELQQLRRDGLTYTFSKVVDREESGIPYHGWGITKKAYGTDEYRAAVTREAELCEECFGIPKEQMLAALLREEGSHEQR